MSGDPKSAIPEDVYGPTSDIIIVGIAAGAFVIFAGELVIAHVLGAPLMLQGIFASIIIASGVFAMTAMRRRSLLRQIYLHGQTISATVINRKEEVLGLFFGAGNVRYWVTVSYELGGGHEIRRRVTDRVYLRCREGGYATPPAPSPREQTAIYSALRVLNIFGIVGGIILLALSACFTV